MAHVESAGVVNEDDRSGVTPLPRLWPGVVLVAAYWGFVVALGAYDLPIFTVFMSSFGASLLFALLFVGWWLSNRRISWSDRLFALAAFVVGAIIAVLAGDPSVGGIGLILFGVPMCLSAWLVWWLIARSRSNSLRRVGLVVVMAVIWGAQTLVRVDGINGSSKAAVAWRWAPTAEDRYLHERTVTKKEVASTVPGTGAEQPLVLQDGDWPDFRGPGRQGELHGVRIATDWNAEPPKQLWRQRIGPAWSSVLIVAGRLFTQEQRGEAEVVVCLDAATGSEIWSHQDAARFSDGQAGAGPRATPTFADGHLFTLGATGILNCLDPATGKVLWSRNIVTDSGAPLPMWGFSSSPLVADSVVVVYAGGPQDKGILAYSAASGEPKWTIAAGPISYSSPQLVSIGGKSQVLLLSDSGLVAIDAACGSQLWNYDAPVTGIWRVVQPRQVADNGLLIGSEDLGLRRLEVAQNERTWTPSVVWASRAMRPAYNDFVVLDESVYGFDEGILCCVDIDTGKRRWKGGRYGHGQMLLLADQRVLLVTSETGEAALVAAEPDKFIELARFQAVVGKTWNHPVIAHGKLFVRNDEEIACYQLKLAE